VAETNKLTEIVVYMKKNPSLRLGIDGATTSYNSDAQAKDLCDRRAKVIRDALVEAGVPSHRISIGAYGNAATRQDRRVEVLIATAN
jgi:outer membrane protein OmpA-like peptidoglycan-associated protein